MSQDMDEALRPLGIKLGPMETLTTRGNVAMMDYLKGNHEVFRSEDGRWFITRSYETGSFRIHDTLHNDFLFVGNMADLRIMSELAAIAYKEASERFQADLLALAGKSGRSDIIAFVPDEDVPF